MNACVRLERLPADSTIAVVLDDLQNESTGAWINNATVTVSVYDSTSTIVGSAQTLTYVTGSNGRYEGTIPYDLGITEGSQYTAKFLAIASAGRRTFAKKFIAGEP